MLYVCSPTFYISGVREGTTDSSIQGGNMRLSKPFLPVALKLYNETHNGHLDTVANWTIVVTISDLKPEVVLVLSSSGPVTRR